MNDYRRVSHVIKAMVWDEQLETLQLLRSFGLEDVSYSRNIFDDRITKLKINTLEGPMGVTPGDYIIKGIDGEFYPCKAAIFPRLHTDLTEVTMPSTDRDSKSVAERYYDEVVKTIDVEKYTRFATYLDELSKEGRINDMRRELAVFVYDIVTQKQKEARIREVQLIPAMFGPYKSERLAELQSPDREEDNT